MALCILTTEISSRREIRTMLTEHRGFRLRSGSCVRTNRFGTSGASARQRQQRDVLQRFSPPVEAHVSLCAVHCETRLVTSIQVREPLDRSRCLSLACRRPDVTEPIGPDGTIAS